MVLGGLGLGGSTSGWIENDLTRHSVSANDIQLWTSALIA